MSTGHPMTGYTDAGETPHWVARLYPHEACCGQPLVSFPLNPTVTDPAAVCRRCRHSGVTPLPYNPEDAD